MRFLARLMGLPACEAWRRCASGSCAALLGGAPWDLRMCLLVWLTRGRDDAARPEAAGYR